MRPLIALLLLASSSLAADPVVHRDLAYVEPKNERQTLDVYAPAEGEDHSIVFWIHGGGWTSGDKSGAEEKARLFVQKGFVFVPANYRFAPQFTLKEMTGDIAKAIRWVHDHAKDFGGDPGRIVVMGHSAGAHLAALVCTDDRYLKGEELSLADIRACVPVDVSAYDIPKHLKDRGTEPSAKFKQVFSESDELHRELSPVTYLAKDKGIPPFLILHVADSPSTKPQSEWFAAKLKEVGVPAKVVAAEGKTHGTINSELGLPDDKPTQALWDFFDEVLKK